MARVHLTINAEFEDCDDECIASVSAMLNQIRDAFVRSVEENGAQLQVTKTLTEQGSSTVYEEVD